MGQQVAPNSVPVVNRVVPGGSPAPAASRLARGRKRAPRYMPLLVLALISLAAGITAAIVNRPASVTLITPHERVITESIAASGLVGGYREVAVGAQAGGIVASVNVVEGQRVHKGDLLAVVDNALASAQVIQARQAVATARAQLAQQSARALSSEVDAAIQRWHQARILAGERRSQVATAREASSQTAASISQALAQLDKARLDVDSANARLALKTKMRDRANALLSQGAIAQQDADQASADYDVAVNEVASAQSQVAYSQSAEAASRSAAHDILVAQAEAGGAARALAIAAADLATLKSQPRPESVSLARQHVRDAETALRVQEANAGSTQVRTPFDGIVTKILAEPGSSSLSGIIKLVEIGRPEIRVNVDEMNLGSLYVGCPAVITSTAYPGNRANGRVSRVGAQVDSSSGTVEVVVRFDPAITWLRPGQTVDVNLVVKPSVKRLLIPMSAVRKTAAGDVVVVVRDGRAVDRPVTIGAPAGSDVPILTGLSASQAIILNADKVSAGKRVRIAGRR